MVETPFASLLMPHDGSPLAGKAALAVEPLLAGGTHVILLQVRDIEDFDERGLEETAQWLEQCGAAVTRRVIEESDAAGAIVDAASELEPDLVVMASHGRGGLDRWVRGSVAERVLRRCPRPLLLVNPHTRAGSRITNVLVPLDGSELSARILDPLLPLARGLGARCTLLFVDWLDPTDTPASAAERAALHDQAIRRQLAEPRARAEAAGVEVELRIERGDVAHEILQAAWSGEFDLLAMTTHGRSGVGRWVMGSIAEKVVRECRIPLLVHRPTSGS